MQSNWYFCTEWFVEERVDLSQLNEEVKKRRCSGWALTLAEWHRSVPLVDPLWSPGACGAALADEPESLVAAETQRAAQLSACQGVHRAIDRVAWRAAIGRYKTDRNV